MKKILIFFFITLLLIVGGYKIYKSLVQPSQVAEIGNTSNRLNGTFLNFGSNTSLPNNEIRGYFAELAEIGMDTVVIGEIQVKSTGCDTSTFAWSPGFPSKLDTIFSSAAQYNIKVYIGLVNNSGCSNPYSSPNKEIVNQYLTNYSNSTNPIQYIVDRFGNNPQLAGWYISDEPGFGWVNLPDLYEYYRNYVNAIKAKSSKPVLVAPSFNAVDISSISPNQFASSIQSFKANTGIDIFVVQDAVNQAGISLTQGDRYTTGQYYQAISAAIGQDSLWADLEIGNCCLIQDAGAPPWNSGAYKPISIARLVEQINMANSTIASKRVTWFNQAQLSRTASERMEGADRLFAAYKSLYVDDGEFTYLTPTSYTWITPPSTQYPDTNNHEMFDLHVGESKNFGGYKNYLDPSYVGIAGSAEISIDLGSAKKVQWVGIHMIHSDSAGISFPSTLSVSCSQDNSSWSTPITFQPLLTKTQNIDKVNSEYVFGNPNSNSLNIDCRYLKLRLGNDANKLTFMSEIEVIGGANYTPTPTPLATTSFTDLDSNFWAYKQINTLFSLGIVSGCSTTPLMYCPDTPVTRAVAAVFMLKSKNGGSYAPPAVTSTRFSDVPSSFWAAPWIEKLAADGITSGCDGSNFCPEGSLTRAQIAVMLLKTKHGSSYTPPAATGIFSDVPANFWAAPWIEELKNEGITSGCGGGNYCPDNIISRAEIAVFLVTTFNLGTSTITSPSIAPSPTATANPLTYLPGDLNTDGKVDIFDYNLLVSKFGNPYTIFDYNNLVANYGKTNN